MKRECELTSKQQMRRQRIEAAAYAVLDEVGYGGASMLAIARRASASNETLYNWYGNKQGLFRSLVEANAGDAKDLLDDALSSNGDPLDTLTRLGPILLTLVTGRRAVSLNRAAAGDVNDTGTLGRAIAEAGRDTIVPRMRSLIERAQEAGLIVTDDSAEAADVYIRLLVGDLQIRRVIGVVDELSQDEIAVRSRQALRLFLAIYRPAR
ncbi:TetR/AcrR family transcriptional regulator [Chelativorans sp. AA-79]|uniref:TetR/AcrR family transcriptional regulator n=1 Tax=Chelativorans sp. AA-79 TaxID=3028735 RepID=UPI0023F6BD93|nr:TetR/AcrR family transcriptional regulator [Chelativorans sp. AA-79]WEX08958.1 TetR/AcrR family transcriptional regulator [Chelativorans sp. AA-79]